MYYEANNKLYLLTFRLLTTFVYAFNNNVYKE
jgi:hypothetical protein